jgi:hypothetical protein
MAWAVGLSVVLHLLLVLFGGYIPVVSQETFFAAEEPPEERITFSFAEETEDAVDRAGEQAPPAPTEPAADLGLPGAALNDLPPGPPGEEAAPSQPPLAEVLPAETTAPSSEALERQRTEAQGWPLEAEGMPQQVPEADTGGGETATPPRPERNLSRALAEFGRALAEAPPRPADVAPGGGDEQNVFVPNLSEIPYTGFGVGNLVFESRDFDWSDYGRQIYMAIWRAWHNRLHVTTDEFEKWAFRNDAWMLDHASQVRFVIQRDGDVARIVLERESGCEPLDRSAVDALDEVILPPLPADFPRDREVVHARFIARGEVRGLKPTLRRYKMLGLF